MATAEVMYADGSLRAVCHVPRFYRPELNVLRLFAFLAVYVCHSIPNDFIGSRMSCDSRLYLLAAVKDAGNFGVCLFFLLSAFLITELLRRERETYGSIHIEAFYLRRILRIWPLYFGITLVYALAGCWFRAMHMESGRIAAYFLLAGNWYIALHPWIQTPLRSLWSISVEEQFYLIWPLLARFGGMRLLAGAALAFIPVSLLTISIVSADKLYAHNTVWLNSFTQFQFFSCGALLALALRGRVPKIRFAVRGIMGCSGILVWLFSAYATDIKRPGADAAAWQFCLGYLLVAAGSILLLLAVLGMDSQRLPQWAMYLGKISFGLYIFHETAFLFADEIQKHLHHVLASWPSPHAVLTLVANKILALGITILLAMLSYCFWETPFLRLRKRFSWIPSQGA